MLNFVWESLLTWIQGAMISALDLLDQSMLFAFSPRLITMDHYFPGLNGMWNLILSISFAMVLALCIFKIFQNSFLTISKSYESPFMTILRSIFALVVITALPQLVRYLFEFADTVYWAVLKEGDMAGDSLTQGNVVTSVATAIMGRVAQAISGGEVDLTAADGLIAIFDVSENVSSLAQFLVCFILTVAIVWNYFKLMLEIAERYVVLGIMYYTMPLAAVPLVSRDTSPITKSWLRMLVSELMILALNVWFVVVFRNAIISSSMIAGEYEVNGHTVGSGLLWCFLAVAFLKTAQKIDSHIATLGLTTAQLSSGIGTTLLATGMGIGHMAKGVKNTVRDVRSAMTGRELAAVKKFDAAVKDGQVFSDAKQVEHIPADNLTRALQTNGNQFQGNAAIAAINKAAPDIVKGKNITSAQIGKNGEFTAHYKDANGKDATLSFTKTPPKGISKMASYGDVQGFVKDTGTPYNYDDVNNGKTSFNDFAEKHLGGSENVLSTSGKFSQQDLNEATVSADPTGDGVIVKDKDGFEMAKISAFDDAHADDIKDNTLIGEGNDGLYRADINTDERYPLPEGYSYAGEVLVDDNGNAISEINSTGFVSTGDNGNGNEYENLSGEFVNSKGEVVSDAHYQDSYRTADGSYISADEMQNIMNERAVAPSDYADNLQYSQDTGFTDSSGNSVNMEKAGWTESESDPGIYNNQYTGGSATGEQIAEHYANPEYASQSYGGFSDDGKEMYFNNYSKESMDKDDMGNERKYGETPDYSNFTSGASGASGSGPRNFSESVENLMDKDYNFTGETGAKIAQAYMPELKNSNIENAYITKDSIRIDKNNGDGTIQRESFASEIGAYTTSGSYSRVESAGGEKTWLKAAKGNSRQVSTEDSSRRYDTPKNGNDSNPRRRIFTGDNRNPKDTRGARGGKGRGKR